MELLFIVLVASVIHSQIQFGETKTVKEYDKVSDLGGYVPNIDVEDYIQHVNEELKGAGKYLEVLNSQDAGQFVSQHIKPVLDIINAPVFQHSKYIGTIRENEAIGTTVSIIGHVRANCVGDEVPVYNLESALESFKLRTVYFPDDHNNALVSLEVFDHEVIDLYNVKILAQCSNGQAAEAVIEAHVLDVNDNIPTFNGSAVIIVASSDQSWGKVATFTAYDRDKNERIIYSIKGSKEFVIDSETGELYAECDYLFQGNYNIQVFATDSAEHISKPLNVKIVVENEVLKFRSFQSPQIHHLSKRATTTIARSYDIVENSTDSVSHLFSVASVQPRPPAERYDLVSTSVDMFLPPSNDGNVYLKPGLKLDYEDENQREILVIFNRTNLNTPEDFTLVEVTVRVLDKNDEKPVFRNKPVPFLAAVSTNPSLGENVYTLYAYDPDPNSRLQYNLDSGGEGKFRIITEQDPETGDMVGKIVTTVSGSGQFSDGQEFPLVVSAQDMSAGLDPPQKSDLVVVNVKVGLRKPQLFENPFMAKVYENSGAGYRILDHANNILRIHVKLFQDSMQNKTNYNLTETNGKLSTLFSITSQGYIETLQNLDYEEPPNRYTLNVTATEVLTGLSSAAQVIIDVEDVNDNSPKFQLSTYTFKLSEDTSVGGPLIPLEVTATDRDSGNNGELEYSVSDDHFTIETVKLGNQYIGRIKVAKQLDYDFLTDHQYRFNVTAKDKGGIRRFGMATVIVYVTNVNDEFPVFGTGTDHLYASISEEQAIGTVVTIIQATDPDGDNVKYYFTPKNTASPPFEIDPDSGLIKLTGTLPESIPFYTLNITAYDDGSCCGGLTSLSSDSYIVVEIKDTNNNQPQFPNCNYKPVVEENQDIGTFVVQATAVDNDRGANGNISYSIVTSPLQGKQFEVDAISGRVVTAVRFDREELRGDNSVAVTVKAADQGTPQSLDSHCTFWVHIGDLNDNNPVFDSPSYATSISESSATIGRRVFAVRATDKDKGDNANIVYTLIDNPGDYFEIEQDTGIIYLKKILSGTDNVVLRVKAQDQGQPPLSAFSSVTISITDRKNNPPTWDSNNYERDYEVKETAPIAHVIASMRAQSNTEAPFDDVLFALIDSNENTVQQLGPFRIQKDSNTVTLILKGQLDYNVQNRYELRLRVTNQAQPPMSAEIRPTIVVKDMNNEPPQFEGLDPSLSNSYKGSVLEEESPGQPVITIKAIDPDHDSPNNVVTYSLMEDPNDAYMHFNIDSLTGLITTRTKFDREQQSVYYIKVKAVDGKNSDAPGHFPANTPNSATAQVQVMIADKNDNAPYFTQDLWEISVPEQMPDSSGNILTVTAKDQDEADQLVYTITQGNINNVFGIKQKTGVIYVAKTLDYETPPTEYRLRVIVQDGLFENSTEVVITVTDVNDNAPEFSENVYEVDSVVEETVPPLPGGQFLVQVSATDKDVSRQNNFRYFLSGDGTNPIDPTFMIEPDTGRIFLRTKLDRDLPNGREVYQFNVQAEDEPGTQDSLFGYAYVQVRPKDINDNSPVFVQSDLHGSVPEHSPKDQSVMTVVATDYDADLNGTVFYEIDGFGNPPVDLDGNMLFKINGATGLIQTSLGPSSLDRERTSQYFVPIVAKDRGTEQRSTTATVTIQIADINDQRPQFVDKIYRVSMSENQKTGPVTTVTAIDRDIDENARLTYTLKESDRSFFSIETVPPNAGVLTVFEEVDYEEDKFFNLTVYVQDSNPDHRDVAYIEVTVLDYNDNAPEFTQKVQTIREKENIPEGKSLWNCSATDKDDGDNAKFSYAIDRSTDEGRRFTVSSSCEVKVRRGLDGETLDREALAGMQDEMYEVHILAIDKGYPAKTGVATLRIFVDDVNDNAPEFVLPHPAMVMEGEEPPQFVITFSARDRDTSDYGAPFNFSLPPCDENPTCKNGDLEFKMDFNPAGDGGKGTGTVTAMKMFSREDQKFYYLPVIMSDMRGKNSAESKTGTSTLTIEIGDINNHPHGPGHKDIFVYKYDFKGAADSIAIGNVYAADLDDWDIKDKHYYFVGSSLMAQYFSVDFDTGEIHMNKRTPGGVYNFNAKVHDFVVFTRINASCTVKVTVQEITDEAVFSSGSLRFTGLTAEEFVTRPKNGKSPYDKFQALLADKLRVPIGNVALFSVMNGPGNEYVEIRYAAHGSPWYSPSKLDSFVALDKDDFEKSSGIKVTMVNVDMCLQETCESGGCSNVLKIGDKPNYVNANGTSFIGVATTVVAKCVCSATDFTAPPDCKPGFCLNGGDCEKDDWGDVKCVNCPEGFNGPRCQMTRHSFNEGYTLFAPFEQCEESSTSIEFITEKADALIFYNGPVSELMQDDPTDFIALSLADGYPVLQVDHGSGVKVLTLDGRDRNGDRHLQKLNDGSWHHIDIIRKGKTLTMIVDRCKMLSPGTVVDLAVDRTPCEVSGETPGENMFLNVNTMLQMGGRYVEPSIPDTVTPHRFKGCVRNLIHNGQLYDLHTGAYAKGENHEDGCPQEDAICGTNSAASSKCGPHGTCEVTDIVNAQFRCTCKSGYRVADGGQACDTETAVRDMRVSSFLGWTLKTEFINTRMTTRNTEVQMMFRTRDPDGILLHLPSNDRQEFITLEIVHGNVRVAYNLGGSTGESYLSLSSAAASNGQWHTVYMTRIGKYFELKMDGGEGRYRNETWGSVGSRESIMINTNEIVTGAHVVFSTSSPVVNGQDLNKTCITDVRLNGRWFPMVVDENKLSEAANLEYDYNVDNDCTRDDCTGVSCPTGLPKSMVCVPLWGLYECRCPIGSYTDGYNCLPIHYCEVENPCFQGATCITKPYPQKFTCKCPVGWTGRLCNKLSSRVPAEAGITTGFIVIILICILVVLTVVLLVFLVIRYKRKSDPEKYILDIDPDDDIRENVIDYNDEGAGEEDYDGYDISRLRKPTDMDTFDRIDPLQAERYGKRAHGERPDVGDFIGQRLDDADHDQNAPPHDSVREFVYEGGGSDIGSLSSLQTSSGSEDQDYDYLNDWGPKFAKLANMYGGEEEDL